MSTNWMLDRRIPRAQETPLLPRLQRNPEESQSSELRRREPRSAGLEKQSISKKGTSDERPCRKRGNG